MAKIEDTNPAVDDTIVTMEEEQSDTQIAEAHETGKEEDLYSTEKTQTKDEIVKISQSLEKIETKISIQKDQACRLLVDTNTPNAHDPKTFKEAKRNHYECGMQSEYLMKLLMKLDNCLSYGDKTIRTERKKLVRRIELAIKTADDISKKWLERSELLVSLKDKPSSERASTIDPPESRIVGALATVPENDDEGQANKGEEIEGHDSATESEDQSQGESDEESDEESDLDTASTQNSDELTMQETLSNLSSGRKCHENTMPVWRPQTRLFQDASHVTVASHLPGMSLEDLEIDIEGHELVVRGRKHPSVADLLAMRRGARPSYGNLALRVALPVASINTTDATASLRDGILQIKFQKKMVPRRRTQRSWPQSRTWPSRAQQSYYRQPLMAGGFGSPFW